MRIEDVDAAATALDGVRRSSHSGRGEWRYAGRLVARQIDAGHVVIRSDFDDRDVLLRTFPETFTVTSRFAKHMMVVAALDGDAGAIEDAIHAAWQLQRRHP